MKRLTDRQIDDLLAGRPAGAGLDDVAEFVAATRTALLEQPDEAVAASHLAAIATEAGEAHQVVTTLDPRPSWRRYMRRTTGLALKLGGAAAALAVGSVGLAYAGVDLPGTAVEEAIEQVLDVQLPNQATDDVSVENGEQSVSDEVKDVIENSESEGCDLGQEVAAAAQANRQGDGSGPDDPCDHAGAGGAQGSRATGEEHSAEGRENAPDKEPQGSKATGEEKSADVRSEQEPQGGRETGEEKSSSDEDPGAEGKSKGEERSSAGKAKGQSHRPDDEPL